jgi:hypothetical protein
MYCFRSPHLFALVSLNRLPTPRASRNRIVHPYRLITVHTSLDVTAGVCATPPRRPHRCHCVRAHRVTRVGRSSSSRTTVNSHEWIARRACAIQPAHVTAAHRSTRAQPFDSMRMVSSCVQQRGSHTSTRQRQRERGRWRRVHSPVVAHAAECDITGDCSTALMSSTHTLTYIDDGTDAHAAAPASSHVGPLTPTSATQIQVRRVQRHEHRFRRRCM